MGRAVRQGRVPDVRVHGHRAFAGIAVHVHHQVLLVPQPEIGAFPGLLGDLLQVTVDVGSLVIPAKGFVDQLQQLGSQDVFLGMRVLLDVFRFFENLDPLKHRALAIQKNIGQLGNPQGVIVPAEYVQEVQNISAFIRHGSQS